MAAAEKKPERQVIFLVGSSHNGANGDRREVDPERAAELVAAGQARYPDSYDG